MLPGLRHVRIAVRSARAGVEMKWRIAILCGVAVLVASCAQLGYYVQAAQGQYALLSDAKPIDEWISDPATGARLKGRLMKVKEIRAFAARELGLPDNGSFKTYTDLKRPFVLWNVVATPELSLKPEQWCFPVAGCVNYRGYYSRDEAQRFAKELRSEGYDVQVGGVPAYSTLGWFNDPVLSTFIQYPDTELARLVFHELAHQVVYVQGDSQFNESFATAVEEAGVERWMEKYGDDSLRKTHAAFEERKNDFLVLLMKYRSELEANYARKASKDEKRKQKTAIFKALVDEYQTLKMVKWGGYAGYDRWFAEPLSNAHLASIATYHDYVPAFRNLLEQEKSFQKFYVAVREIAQHDRQDRNTQLALLNKGTMMAGQPGGVSASSNAAPMSDK
jgi:predicted aminopeptidase